MATIHPGAKDTIAGSGACRLPDCGVPGYHVHMALKNPRLSAEEEARRAWKLWERKKEIPNDLSDGAKAELRQAVTRSIADLERLLEVALGEAARICGCDGGSECPCYLSGYEAPRRPLSY